MAKQPKRSRLIGLLASVALYVVPCTTLAQSLDHSTGSGQKLATAEAAAGSDDEGAIRATAPTYIKAFAAADAAAIAAMWTENGTYVMTDGSELTGRSAIEKTFTDLFKKGGGQTLDVHIESIRFPAPNVAIEEGTTWLAKDPAHTTSKYTVVHVKKNGTWLMESVTELNATPPAHEDKLEDLGWLVGKWTATTSHGNEVHVDVDWAENHKFLRSVHKIDGAGQCSQTEMIGRSPTTGRVVSWHFDSTGGFGFGRWSRDGQKWTERTNGVQDDGSSSHAEYILNKISNDSFTWQSKNRVCNGANLPDLQTITIVRAH